MTAALPVEVQVYLFGLLFAVAVPLVIYWMLRKPLGEFLKKIFDSPPIEQFWMRVVLIGFLASTLSTAIVFQPIDQAKIDEVATIFMVADKCKAMLDSLIFAMLAIFLPLLASYTLLHMPRRDARPREDS